MPFITEEIWTRVAPLARPGGTPPGASIMNESYPAPTGADAAVDAEMAWVMAFILGIRQIRGEMDIPPSRRFDVLLSGADATDLARLGRSSHLIERLANVSGTRVLETDATQPESAVALVGSLRLLVPLAGLIDVNAEIARIEKRLVKAEAERAKAHAKLSNGNFATQAPAAVVEQERARLAGFERDCAALTDNLAKLRRLGAS